MGILTFNQALLERNRSAGRVEHSRFHYWLPLLITLLVPIACYQLRRDPSAAFLLSNDIAPDRLFEQAFGAYVVESQAVPISLIALVLGQFFGPGVAAKGIIAALIIFLPKRVSTMVGSRNRRSAPELRAGYPGRHHSTYRAQGNLGSNTMTKQLESVLEATSW